jgi:hypothetical protein
LTNRNSDLHKLIYFGTEDASTLTNSPIKSGAFYGYRVVRWNGTSATEQHMITVEVHEQYPNAGRIWVNTHNKNYSAGWYGWKEINVNNVNKLMVQKFTANSLQFAAYGSKTITISTPSGYSFVGFLGCNASGSVSDIYLEWTGSTSTKAIIWNPSATAKTLSVDVFVLYSAL